MSAYVFSNIDSMHHHHHHHRTDGSSRADGPSSTDYHHYNPAPPHSAMVPLHCAAAPPQPSEFICNVSDDDTVERDIDLEIEARIRSLTFLSDDDSTAPQPQPSTPEMPRTMSQRMLSSLQKNRLNQMERSERRAHSAARLQTHAVTAAANVAAAPPVRSERSFYDAHTQQPHTGTSLAAAPKVIDSSVRGNGELRGTQLSARSSTSCTDRLEARISKSFLHRQDSVESDSNDLSIMYSGRRTYPAESIKKNDQRLSEGTPAIAQPATSMMSALERERHAMALAGLDSIGATRTIEPEVLKAAAHGRSKRTPQPQDSGMSFHFHGGSSRSNSVATEPQRHCIALAPPEPSPRRYIAAPSPQTQPSHALVVPTRSAALLDPKFTALATQLGEIEALVDSIEHCLSTSMLLSLVPVVLSELDLLKGSTAQIRANGATLILAEVGRPPTETVHALRQLVARAAAVQYHIEAIVAATRRRV